MTTSSGKRYVVAGSRPWSRAIFEQRIRHLRGQWSFVSTPQELTLSFLDAKRPALVFFLHWSWRVPDEIVERYECICFHMTAVPFGRGGSPLQNLIVRGFKSTVLTALKMVREMDAGPIYLQRELSLEGGAEEIYLRASELAYQMIEIIVRDRPTPHSQEGEPVVFSRRTPDASALPTEVHGLAELFDFIRMLDAEGYPRAFLRHGAFKLEFSRAALYSGRIKADVIITREGDERDDDPGRSGSP